MSYYIRILAKSKAMFPMSLIRQFVLDGIYFEAEPLFDPSMETVTTTVDTWEQLSIRYEHNKRPILIYRNADDSLHHNEVHELIELMRRYGDGDIQNRILSWIAQSQQIITFEIDPEGLSEAGWEMLSALESHLASQYEGIIYADDGFYDHNLELIFQLSDR